MDRERIRAEVDRLARKYPILKRVLDDAETCADPDRPNCRCRWFKASPYGFYVATMRVPCWWSEYEAQLYALLLVSAAIGDLSHVENYLMTLKAAGVG